MTISSEIKREAIDQSGDKNLWANLLSEVHNKSSQRLPTKKSILILGDEQVGKSSLLIKLKDGEISKGYALEYQSIEVKDEEREDYTRLGIWVGDSRCYNPPINLQYSLVEPQIAQQNYSEGNNQHHESILSELLINALSAKNIAETMVIIVISMAQPWTMIESLKKWLYFIEEHIRTKIVMPKKIGVQNKLPSVTDKDQQIMEDKLTPQYITSQKYEELKQKMIKKFLSYLEKDETKSIELQYGNKDIDGIQISDVQLQMLLQDENILSNNLGIPVLVVVTKTDIMTDLMKEYDFKNEHFDYIQQHIRTVCLSYGAGLLYTSSKENKNCDLLRQYILHLMYSFPFKKGPKIIDNDSIFIPIGWDSTKKIAILNEGLINILPNSEFEDVLGKTPYKKIENCEPEILAEDEQVFLARMQGLLAQPLKNRNEIISNKSSALSKNLPQRSSPYIQTDELSSNPLTQNLVGSGSHQTINASDYSTAIAKASINGMNLTSSTSATTNIPLESTTNSERVLTSFFNSLLNKKSSAATINNSLNTSNNSGNLGATLRGTLNPNKPPAASARYNANTSSISNPRNNPNISIGSSSINTTGGDDSFMSVSNTLPLTDEASQQDISSNDDPEASTRPGDPSLMESAAVMSLNEMAEHLNRVASSSIPTKSPENLN